MKRSGNVGSAPASLYLFRDSFTLIFERVRRNVMALNYICPIPLDRCHAASKSKNFDLGFL